MSRGTRDVFLAEPEAISFPEDIAAERFSTSLKYEEFA